MNAWAHDPSWHAISTGAGRPQMENIARNTVEDLSSPTTKFIDVQDGNMVGVFPQDGTRKARGFQKEQVNVQSRVTRKLQTTQVKASKVLEVWMRDSIAKLETTKNDKKKKPSIRNE